VALKVKIRVAGVKASCFTRRQTEGKLARLLVEELEFGADGALADAESLGEGSLAGGGAALEGHPLEALLELGDLGRAGGAREAVRERLDGLRRAARELLGRRLEQQLAVLPRQPDGGQRLAPRVLLAAAQPLLPLKVLDDPRDVLVAAQTRRRTRHLKLNKWLINDASTCFIFLICIYKVTR